MTPVPNPSFARRRALPWLAIALCTLAAGCDGGAPLPEVSRVRHRRLTGGRSAVPWPVILEGRGFATSAREPLAFELMREEPPSPRVRIALAGLRVESDTRAQAQVPAGISEGTYRLVVRRGRRWRLAPQHIRVEAQKENSAPALLSSVRARPAVSGEGGRLVISGANLVRPVLVTLHGPLQRSTAIRPEVKALDARKAKSGPPRVTVPGVTDSGKPSLLGHHGHDHGGGEEAAKRAEAAAKIVGDSPKPLFKRMAITELSTVTEVHGTRFFARLPRTLRPGSYFVQAYTSTHRGNEPDILMVVAPPGAGHPRLLHFLWLGLLLAGVLLGVVTLARARRVSRGVVIGLVGAAAACLLPFVFLV